MSKQKNRRIGLGMEPRGNAAKMAPGAPVSRESAHEEVAEEVEMEVVLGEQKGEGLELRGVQNLDSGQLEAAGDTGGDTIVAQIEDFDRLPEPTEAGEDLLAAMLKESKMERPYPEDDGSKPSIAEIEKAIESGAKVEIAPNGDVTIQPAAPLGELPNGEYRATVRIAECYVEGCRQQAEADGVSLEDWLSGHLGSYLENWWGAPGAK